MRSMKPSQGVRPPMRFQRQRAQKLSKTDPRHFPGLALHLLMLASGGLALVYEILWLRRFAAVFGATTPAVAATLAAMFLGLCIGSLAAMRHAPRLKRPLR